MKRPAVPLGPVRMYFQKSVRERSEDPVLGEAKSRSPYPGRNQSDCSVV